MIARDKLSQQADFPSSTSFITMSEILRLIQTFQDNYFERDFLKHAIIGYLEYMSITVRNQR